MSATLPSARHSTSAVWDGTNAYIFGGHDGSSPLNQIVRYNPATNVVTTLAATLPSGRFDTSAIWDGQNAYIVGGRGTSGPLSEIVRYNPATGVVTPMAALPTPRTATSAVWDGTAAYIFGGMDSSSALLKQIVRYAPGAAAAPDFCVETIGARGAQPSPGTLFLGSAPSHVTPRIGNRGDASGAVHWKLYVDGALLSEADSPPIPAGSQFAPPDSIWQVPISATGAPHILKLELSSVNDKDSSNNVFETVKKPFLNDPSDADDDGFDNQAEQAAGTSFTDPHSFPPHTVVCK